MKHYLDSTCWKLVGLVTCILWSSWSLASDQGDMKQRLLACASCHEYEDHEQLPYAPSIAGKPVEYLYQQLLNYREGRRLNSAMGKMLAYLRDDYLREMANYYADLPEEVSLGEYSSVEQSSAQAIVAQTLVHTGGIGPACIACHGDDLRGDGVAIPSLRGLSAKYIAAQLGAWQTNTRHARAPDCMKEVADMLTDDDINAVSQWIAHSLEEASISQAIDAEIPLPCGAVQ